MKLNKSLQKQLAKLLAPNDKFQDKYYELLKAISDHYDHSEQEKKILKRSIELASSQILSVSEKLKKNNNDLIKTNNDLKSLFENVSEVLFCFDEINNKLLHISKACESVFGHSQEAFMNNQQLFNNVIFNGDFELIRTHLKTNEKFVKQYCIDKGKIKWVELKIKGVFENGILSRYDGIVIDISERKYIELELLESKNQIQTIFNAALDAIIIIDEQGIITRWDSKAEALFGWTEAELIGTQLADSIIPQRHRQAHMDGMKHFLKTGHGPVLGKTIEVRALNKSNIEFDISLSISPSLINNKHQFIGFIRDISERKRVETALQLSEKRFRRLIENSEDAISLLDAHSNILYQSPSVERMLGYSSEERLHLPGLTGIHPDDAAETKRIYNEVLNTSCIAIPFQLRRLHKNGTYIWIEGTIMNMLADESVKAIVANYRNISSRREAETAHNESENKYRTLFEKMVDGMYKSTHDGKFIEVNPSLVKMLGYNSKDELMSIDIKTDLYFETTERDNAVEQDNAEGMSVFRLKKKDGSEIWVEDRGQYVYDSDGNTLYHEGILRDVTKRIYTQLELKRSQQEIADYKKALDQSSIVSITNKEGFLTYANDNFCKISGYTKEELSGKSEELMYSDFHTKKLLRNIHQTISKGAVWRGELKNKTKDGSTYWIDSAVVPFLNGSGQPYQYLTISVDITERKISEEALQANELKFRLLIENNADMITMMDSAGKFLYVSPAVVKQFNYSFDECICMSATDLIHPDDIEKSQQFLYEVMQNPGVPVQGPVIRNKKKDGSYVWVEGTLTNLLENEGINAIVSNFRDITVKKITEEKIRNSEERYRNTLDNLMEGVQIIDYNWKYIYVNDAFVKHSKYSREELIGKTVMEKFPGIEELDIYKIYERCFNERVSIHLENKFTFPDGSTGWFDLSFQPVSEGIFILSVDITERKQTEIQIYEQNEELRKANSELDKFVYSVSHDLRAPLLSMQGVVEITEAETSEELTSEHMKMLRGSINKLDSFIGEILEYSRNARVEVKPEIVDFNLMLQELQSGLKHMNRSEKSVAISFEVNTIELFYSDVSRLNIILNNLVSNSIRYCNPQAEFPFVKISVISNSDFAQIAVEDNGIGISEESKGKIFDMFYRASETSAGSGLGLYIVKEAIEKLQGKIEVESTPGSGTKFITTIPNILFQ
jgi:PAS domain S-box-containing protein